MILDNTNLDQCTISDGNSEKSFNVIDNGCFNSITNTVLVSDSAIQPKAIRFSYRSFSFGEQSTFQQSVVCQVKFCLQKSDYFCGYAEKICPEGYYKPQLPPTTTTSTTTTITTTSSTTTSTTTSSTTTSTTTSTSTTSTTTSTTTTSLYNRTPKPVEFPFPGHPGCIIPDNILAMEHIGFYGSKGKGLPVLVDGVVYWTQDKLLSKRTRFYN